MDISTKFEILILDNFPLIFCILSQAPGFEVNVKLDFTDQSLKKC